MWFLLLRQTLIRGGIDKMKGISEKTLIKIKDLKASVKLNNGDMLTTVTNANMELQRGRSYAIVGKSGSGKTSLISIIGLLNREYEGEYLYDGISISALKDRDLSILRANNIGFVFQNYSLIKHLRVWENIELPLLYAKKSFTAKQRHEIITGLLKSVGLESKEMIIQSICPAVNNKELQSQGRLQYLRKPFYVMSLRERWIKRRERRLWNCCTAS